jgi:tetratricopeptide (TPR) repeat protein
VIDLERGRVRRSSGDKDSAYPLFVAAFDAATETGQTFVAADAAHMAALAAPDGEGFVAWTERGLATGDPYWPGSLLNNLGWEYFEAGDHAEALDAFERALEARQRFPEQPANIELARYAVAKVQRALGRPAEAAAALELAVAWADDAGQPDGWFHEELALAYADLGDDRAAEQARLAAPLLERDDPGFDGERAERLRALTDGLSRPAPRS